MILNKDELFSYIGGKHPLKYVQNGHGFDADGNCIGSVDDNFDLVEIPASVEEEIEAVLESGTGDQVFETQGVTYSDREALETLAADLGVTFRSNISDEKLKERVEAAQSE